MLLICPYLISGKTSLTIAPWPDVCIDEHILLHTDSLLTIGEPKAALKELYIKKAGKKIEELTKPAQPQLLNEEPSDETDEPRYVEEPLY